MLVSMVEACIMNPKHINALYDDFLKREKKLSSRVRAPVESENFSKQITTLAAFVKEEEEFVIYWLMGRSGLTCAEIMQANGHDDTTILSLVIYETQLEPNIAFHPCCQIKYCMKHVLNQLSDANGNRLNNWKANNGLLPNGGINWRNACYQIVWNNGNYPTLKSVTHKGTGLLKLTDDTCITKKWRLENNESERHAVMIHPTTRTQNVKLYTLFQKNEGPNSIKHYSSKSHEWAELCGRAYSEWAALQARTSTAEAASGLEEMYIHGTPMASVRVAWVVRSGVGKAGG